MVFGNVEYMARKKKKEARLFKILGIAVLALIISSQLTYTKNFRTNVLGDEDQAADGVKVKTKVEDDGSRKVEIEKDNVKFKFEQENGEVKLKVENEEGKEVEDHDDKREELEDELEDEDIDVATEDGHMVIEHNRVRARTNFPLSINPETKEFIVTTPAGERSVAVLPDEAIQNMLAQGFFTRDVSSEISLHDGNVVYEIKGQREHNFLGFVPVTTPQTVMVSAQTGDVIAQTQSWLATTVDLLSF